MSSRTPTHEAECRPVLPVQSHTDVPMDESKALRAERLSRPEGLSVYARSNLGRALISLATSVVPLLGLWVLMYFALGVSYVLALVLAVPTAGFMVRTYILFHDCAHGSLLRGRRANARLGAVLAVMVFTPFARWRHDHAVHHATAGDLDRRGTGTSRP